MTFIRSQMGKGRQGLALVSGACPEEVLNGGELLEDFLWSTVIPFEAARLENEEVPSR